jgi:hypothetical protein
MSKTTVSSKKQAANGEDKSCRAVKVTPSTKRAGPTNLEFRCAVFHTVPEGAHIWGTAFKTPPDLAAKRDWFGGVITGRSLTKKTNYTRGDCNTFYSVSSFRPDAKGKVHRRKDQYAAAHVMTLDDIGGGPSAKIPAARVVLPPSFVIETSPDNSQVGYILKKPETDADLFNRVVDALIEQGLASPTDPGMKGVTRYVRFPVGINNKTKYDPAHLHVVKGWNPERQYSLQDIVDAYGLVLAPPEPERHYTATTMTAEGDPYLKVLEANDHVLTGEIRDGNKVDILCPFHHEHTDRAAEGAVYYIGGGFYCFHGHCLDRTSYEFKQKLADDYWIDLNELDHVLRAARVGTLVGGVG